MKEIFYKKDGKKMTAYIMTDYRGQMTRAYPTAESVAKHLEPKEAKKFLKEVRKTQKAKDRYDWLWYSSRINEAIVKAKWWLLWCLHHPDKKNGGIERAARSFLEEEQPELFEPKI